jgi:hypothetical protein
LFLEDEKMVSVSCGTTAINSMGHVIHKVITADLARHEQYPSQIGRLRGCVLFDESLKEILIRNSLMAGWCSYVFSTEAVRSVGLFDDTMVFATDFDLMSKLASKGIFVHINKDMCSARFHSHRVTKKLELEIISREIRQVCDKFSGQIEPNKFQNILDILEFKRLYRLLKDQKSPVHLAQFLMYSIKPKIMTLVVSRLRS